LITANPEISGALWAHEALGRTLLTYLLINSRIYHK